MITCLRSEHSLVRFYEAYKRPEDFRNSFTFTVVSSSARNPLQGTIPSIACIFLLRINQWVPYIVVYIGVIVLKSSLAVKISLNVHFLLPSEFTLGNHIKESIPIIMKKEKNGAQKGPPQFV